MHTPEPQTNKILGFLKKLLLWGGSLSLWFWYAFYTLDRSPAAFEETGGSGPMLSGYSIALLAVLLALLLSKQFFSKKKTAGSVAIKGIVILILILGLYTQISYDPTLSNLRSQPNARAGNYSGMELFDAVNNHRRSIGVQEIQLEETFCGNLVERWMAVKSPENGHRGFDDWWADKSLKEDPYGQINELYGSARSAERVVEIWTKSPGHKIPLEDPKYNVGCTYAAEGWGVLIIGEKPKSL